MNYDIKTNLNAFLSRHSTMTVSTASSNGKPMAHTVCFAHKENRVYFPTSKNSRKITNIASHPDVLITMYDQPIKYNGIQSIQIGGKAFILTEPDRIKEAEELLKAKIPELSTILQQIPNCVICKIELTEGHLIDNKIHFGFTVKIKY